jgi:hypothetical protein
MGLQTPVNTKSDQEKKEKAEFYEQHDERHLNGIHPIPPTQNEAQFKSLQNPSRLGRAVFRTGILSCISAKKTSAATEQRVSDQKNILKYGDGQLKEQNRKKRGFWAYLQP